MADLLDRGCVPVLADVAAQVVEDLFLAPGQVHADLQTRRVGESQAKVNGISVRRTDSAVGPGTGGRRGWRLGPNTGRSLGRSGRRLTVTLTLTHAGPRMWAADDRERIEW